eukprot:2176523-Pleurochrysis_carterae.AAC.2
MGKAGLSSALVRAAPSCWRSGRRRARRARGTGSNRSSAAARCQSQTAPGGRCGGGSAGTPGTQRRARKGDA